MLIFQYILLKRSYINEMKIQLSIDDPMRSSENLLFFADSTFHIF